MAINITNITDGATYGVRSPLWFTASVNTIGEVLVDATLEIFIWTGLIGDKPATPNYTLFRDQSQFGSSAATTEFNLAPFAREGITYTSFDGGYQDKFACWMSVDYDINHDDGSAQNTTGTIDVLCTDGWGEFEGGDSVELLPWNFASEKIYALEGETLPITFLATQIGGGASTTITNVDILFSDGTTDAHTVSGGLLRSRDLFSVYSLSIPSGVEWVDITPDTTGAPTLRVEVKPKKKYNVTRVGYVDKNGCISYVSFFGNQLQSRDVRRESFKRYLGSLRTPAAGAVAQFNVNGMERLTLNTDWVPEAFEDNIKELILSQYHFIADAIVTVTDWHERVINDGGTIESLQCANDTLYLEFGIDPATLCTKTVTFGTSTALIPETSSYQKLKQIDGLMSYQIEFRKAFDTLHTFR